MGFNSGFKGLNKYTAIYIGLHSHSFSNLLFHTAPIFPPLQYFLLLQLTFSNPHTTPA